MARKKKDQIAKPEVSSQEAEGFSPVNVPKTKAPRKKKVKADISEEVTPPAIPKPRKKKKTEPSVVIEQSYAQEIETVEFTALAEPMVTPKQSYLFQSIPDDPPEQDPIKVLDEIASTPITEKDKEKYPVRLISAEEYEMDFDEFKNVLHQEMLPGFSIVFGGDNPIQEKMLEYRKKVSEKYGFGAKEEYSFFFDKDTLYISRSVKDQQNKDLLLKILEHAEMYRKQFSFAEALIFYDFDIRIFWAVSLAFLVFYSNWPVWISMLYVFFAVGFWVFTFFMYQIELFSNTKMFSYLNEQDRQMIKEFECKFECSVCEHKCNSEP